MTRRGERQAGFTLLEVVVAVTVFAILLLTLARGTQFGLAAFDRQGRMAETAGRLEAVDTLLRRLLAGLDPGTQVDGSTVTGAPHAMAFRAPLPTGRGTDDTPEMADLRLSVDDGHRLLLSWLPYQHVIRTGAPRRPDTAVLLDGVDHIDLDYWSDGGWHPRWEDRQPPSLIRIRIVFSEGDARHWPDIVVAPEREQG
ncbi:MAG: prepilin-type N-terminal cleavage/methylation domain-containing protein [Gluconacetobacter diazotrophicus]|nr:prepilin-type N-terminal cleavage/methylation domain-containing protein [Gluconacetobacter diazotrophicus]